MLDWSESKLLVFSHTGSFYERAVLFELWITLEPFSEPFKESRGHVLSSVQLAICPTGQLL